MAPQAMPRNWERAGSRLLVFNAIAVYKIVLNFFIKADKLHPGSACQWVYPKFNGRLCLHLHLLDVQRVGGSCFFLCILGSLLG
jgi:hypothetical protein